MLNYKYFAEIPDTHKCKTCMLDKYRMRFVAYRREDGSLYVEENCVRCSKDGLNSER